MRSESPAETVRLVVRAPDQIIFVLPDEESHSATWVTVQAGIPLNSTAAEAAMDPPDAALKVTVWRA